MAAPLFRLPSHARLAAVRPLVGKMVTVTFDRHRDGSNLETLVGLLVAVATPYGSGAQSHSLILRTGGPASRDFILSIARVRACDLLVAL